MCDYSSGGRELTRRNGAGGLLKRAKGAVLLLGEDHDKEVFIFSEKSSKKVLTKSVKRSILTELSARGTKQAAGR